MNDTEILEKLLTYLAQRGEEIKSEMEDHRYMFDFNEWKTGILKGKMDALQEIQDFIDDIR